MNEVKNILNHQILNKSMDSASAILFDVWCEKFCLTFYWSPVITDKAYDALSANAPIVHHLCCGSVYRKKKKNPEEKNLI